MIKQLSAPFRSLVFLVCLFSINKASATLLDISADLTVDNGFDLYISTDSTSAGTLIGSNNSWPTVSSFNFDLTEGVTNYIHILAKDWGVIGGVLGDFTLNNSDFQFANGSQYLTTNTTDWEVSLLGFGVGSTAPISYGKNGVGPWGFRGGIDTDADWIWDPSGCVHCTAYFTTAVTWVGSTAVPEPSSTLLLIAGILTMGVLRRRIRTINPS